MDKPFPVDVASAFSVSGQSVIVTGAAGLIGGGITEAFAANGATVLATDLPGAKLDAAAARWSAASLSVRAHPADLCSPSEIRAIVAAAVSHAGRLTTIVNCAGIGQSGLIRDEDEADFDRLFHTNLRSMWLLCKHAYEPIKLAGGGAVVNISSINGHRAHFYCSLYTGTKAAMLAMSRELAVEFAPGLVRVNTISPGAIPHKYDRTQWARDMLHEPYASEIVAMFEGMQSKSPWYVQPLQTAGHPMDIAMACIYLSSPASRFVTGADLLVDGGKTQEMHEIEPRFHTRNHSPFVPIRQKMLTFPDSAWKAEMPNWLKRHRTEAAKA